MRRTLLLVVLGLLACCGTPRDDDTSATCEPELEFPYDGVDQDCDGADLTDVDGDGWDASEVGGGDCDDADPAIHPDAEEIWYDGIDQDCDGASDDDQDGDGFDSADHGGTDCDDELDNSYPGAWEVCDGVDNDCDGLVDAQDPDITRAGFWFYDHDGDGYGVSETWVYACEQPAAHADRDGDCDDDDASIHPGMVDAPSDGVDQDCDGIDPEDLDGDGWGDAAGGGGDCDDNDPSVNPGVTEARGDEIDNDCDGRTDEYLVCADGSGDFTTVQEGIDGVPSPALLEICPGTYRQNLEIGAQTIEIQGGGAEPGDVVLKGGIYEHVTVAEGADVSISWLRMEPASDGTQTAFRARGDSLSVDLVDFCSADGHYDRFLSGTVSDSSEITLTRSRICASASDADFAYFHLYESSLVLERNIFVIDPAVEYYRMTLWVDSATVAFRNNLVTGGDARFFCGGGHNDEHPFTLEIEHNTFARMTGFTAAVQQDTCHGVDFPSVRMQNNIISEILVGPIWYASVEGYSKDYTEYAPDPLYRNLLWDIDGDYGELYLVACSGHPDEWLEDTKVLSNHFASSSLVRDPLFTPDPYQGSFALDPSSPAIDAGTGSPDPDGSRADIGAFGGPEGDWWQEVPWTLP